MRTAAQACRAQGIDRIAVSSAFAPINPAMEDRAAAVIAAEHPGAIVSLSHRLGRLGLIERAHGTIINPALSSIAPQVDRQGVVAGKSVVAGGDLDGRRTFKNKT